MKSLCALMLILTLFVCSVLGQEVFYREKQSGANLGLGFSDGKNSTSTSYNVSFVFNGTILLNGQYGTASYSDDNVITTEAEVFSCMENKKDMVAKAIFTMTALTADRLKTR